MRFGSVKETSQSLQRICFSEHDEIQELLTIMTEEEYVSYVEIQDEGIVVSSFLNYQEVIEGIGAWYKCIYIYLLYR